MFNELPSRSGRAMFWPMFVALWIFEVLTQSCSWKSDIFNPQSPHCWAFLRDLVTTVYFFQDPYLFINVQKNNVVYSNCICCCCVQLAVCVCVPCLFFSFVICLCAFKCFVCSWLMCACKGVLPLRCCVHSYVCVQLVVCMWGKPVRRRPLALQGPHTQGPDIDNGAPQRWKCCFQFYWGTLLSFFSKDKIIIGFARPPHPRTRHRQRGSTKMEMLF